MDDDRFEKWVEAMERENDDTNREESRRIIDEEASDKKFDEWVTGKITDEEFYKSVLNERPVKS